MIGIVSNEPERIHECFPSALGRMSLRADNGGAIAGECNFSGLQPRGRADRVTGTVETATGIVSLDFNPGQRLFFRGRPLA